MANIFFFVFENVNIQIFNIGMYKYIFEVQINRK